VLVYHEAKASDEIFEPAVEIVIVRGRNDGGSGESWPSNPLYGVFAVAWQRRTDIFDEGLEVGLAIFLTSWRVS